MFIELKGSNRMHLCIQENPKSKDGYYRKKGLIMNYFSKKFISIKHLQ